MGCEVSFAIPPELRGPKKKAARWAPNPEEHWGPKRRAGRAPVAGAEGGEGEEEGDGEGGEGGEEETGEEEQGAGEGGEKKRLKVEE